MKKIVFILGILLCFVPSAFASKEGQVKKGNALYHKGQFDASIQEYEKALKSSPESPEINFNLGTALYKDERYVDAVAPLQKGLLSHDPEVKKKAQFNLGNAYYGLGLQVEDKKVDEAIQVLEESLRQFETLMNVNDKDQDARYNHDVVKKKLEELKKKQQQQKQNQKDQQQKAQNEQSEQQQQNPQNSEKKDDSSASQQNSGQDQKPEEKNQKEDQQNSGNSEPQHQTGQSKDKSENQQPKPGEMTKEEAKMLLRQFEQNEQPQSLLNFQKGSGEERPVLKDW